MLGCGAHLKELIRTESGAFRLDRALPLDTIPSQDSSNGEIFQKRAQERMVSMSQSLSFLPKIVARENLIEKIRHGQPIHPGDMQGRPMDEQINEHEEDSFIRVVDKKDNLLAVVSFDQQRRQFVYSCVLAA